MARCSTCSAITQASSILPTESAPPSATHETHTESHKCGTSAADLTAQPPTKKANIPISDEEEAENVKEKQVKKVKKIVKGKKGKKTQKTSEMKAAEDAAADAEAADRCLFVYESKAWNLLGSFETAVMEDEEINWLKIDGELILPSGFKPNATPPVNNEISFIQSKSAGSSAASSCAVSHSHTPSLVQRGGISEQHTEELIAVLKIPQAIVESTSPGLQVTYQKYIACIEAISEHNVMEKNRT
ncbi:hypothetical protein BDQ17DRAFT_1543409 [Cyathus striatus]|nr:hypothetical protein BDQ17DRAFT_1543409 [Cyathus striatus]